MKRYVTSPIIFYAFIYYVGTKHNRVYEGRAMRVQLRDCNPPRSPWKLTRGRGRFQNHDQFSPRRFILPDGFGDKSSFNIGQDQVISPSHADTLESSFAPEHSKGTVNLGNERDSDLSVVPHIQKSDERLSADAPSEPQQGRSPESLPTSHKTENYREWYDDLESPVNAPTSPSFNSLASINTPFTPSPYPYPLPSSPYYSAMPPWVHPYAQQPPYPMPFYNGYPMYPPHLPPPPPAFATPPGSDANGPAGGPGWPPVGMYGVSLTLNLIDVLLVHAFKVLYSLSNASTAGAGYRSSTPTSQRPSASDAHGVYPKRPRYAHRDVSTRSSGSIHGWSWSSLSWWTAPAPKFQRSSLAALHLPLFSTPPNPGSTIPTRSGKFWLESPRPKPATPSRWTDHTKFKLTAR